MDIQLVSDLHLDYGDIELPGGDILIIAGDACEITRLDNKNKHQNQRFFFEELPKYQKILYVFGNHEHYYGRYDKSFQIIENLKIPNLIVLHNSSIDIDNYKFLGTTLWTNFGGDMLTYTKARDVMNDYKKITVKDAQGYHKLNNKFILAENRKAVNFLNNTLSESTKNNIVITHHAPSKLSAPQALFDDQTVDYYCNNLDNLILNNNIDYWFHGHIHDPISYSIGNTKIITNPRGYIGHDAQDDYKPINISLKPQLKSKI